MTSNDKTVEEPKITVQVVDLSARIEPHMSDRARAALRFNKHPGWSDDMVTIARMWDHEPDDDDIRELGADISVMVDNRELAEVGVAMDGLMSVPVLVPLAQEQDGRFLAVLFARAVGADRPEVMARLREMLPGLCRLHAIESGALPPAVHART